MKAALLIFCFPLIFISCKKKDKIPENILAPKKMQAVLWDIMRADKFLTDFVLNKDTLLDKKSESIKLYQQVLSIHNIDKEKFKKSFIYYQAHPLFLKEIMDSISNRPGTAPTQILGQTDTINKLSHKPFLTDTSVAAKRRKSLKQIKQ